MGEVKLQYCSKIGWLSKVDIRRSSIRIRSSLRSHLVITPKSPPGDFYPNPFKGALTHRGFLGQADHLWLGREVIF
jgi:hypothetical protein